ncbi:MAG: zinc ribbon-containing protein, partial [Thermoleophilaceae bacterium]
MPRSSPRSPANLRRVRKLRKRQRQRARGWVDALVIIRTISGGETDTVPAGTLAGAGCFRCDSCGYAVALQELDEVPACPHCGGA